MRRLYLGDTSTEARSDGSNCLVRRMVIQRFFLLTLSLLLLATCCDAANQNLQPVVTVVEPRARAFGSIMLPNGSPWCGGAPTYWWTGHGNPEIPGCEVAQGTWLASPVALLDAQDTILNRTGIDRHGCAAVDVNHDGLPDVICTVGALKGKGYGYTEVYLTQLDGSLIKIADHGLYESPTMRGRNVIALQGWDGSNLVLLTTNGWVRGDGLPNYHRLYRNAPHQLPNGWFFEEIPVPSINDHTNLTKVVVADFDGNGVDDLLFCFQNQRAQIFIQKRRDRWTRNYLPTGISSRWRSARAIDVTNDGVLDLIVVGYPSSFGLKVFEGLATRTKPFFNMTHPYFEADLPHVAPDIEVLDVNGDGILDIYVVQTNQTGTYQENYCAGRYNTSNQKTPGWMPPNDPAQDLLFVGTNDNGAGVSWTAELMVHSHPGCGGLVRPYGPGRLALAQGIRSRPGSNLLLEWPGATVPPAGDTTSETNAFERQDGSM